MVPLDLFLLIVALSAIAVLQFFRGRRQNLILMKFTVETLEKILAPVDKVYQLVGIYVGYRAVLWLRRKNLSRAEATVLLMPRYSAFYYPISKLVNRFDRIYLTYWFSRPTITSETHLIRVGGYRRSLKRVVRDCDRMVRSEVVVKGVRFVALSRDGKGVGKLVRFLESLERPEDVVHVALVPQNNSIYIFARIDPDTFANLVERSYRLAQSFA